MTDIQLKIEKLRDKVINLLKEEEQLQANKKDMADDYNDRIKGVKKERKEALEELDELEKSMIEDEGTAFLESVGKSNVDVSS